MILMSFSRIIWSRLNKDPNSKWSKFSAKRKKHECKLKGLIKWTEAAKEFTHFLTSRSLIMSTFHWTVLGKYLMDIIPLEDYLWHSELFWARGFGFFESISVQVTEKSMSWTNLILSKETIHIISFEPISNKRAPKCIH